MSVIYYFVIFSFVFSSLSAKGSSYNRMPSCLNHFCLDEQKGLLEDGMFRIMGKAKGFGDKNRRYFCYSTKTDSSPIFTRFESLKLVRGFQIVSVRVSNYRLCKSDEEVSSNVILKTKDDVGIGSPVSLLKRKYEKFTIIRVNNELLASDFPNVDKNLKLDRYFYSVPDEDKIALTSWFYVSEGRIVDFSFTIDE